MEALQASVSNDHATKATTAPPFENGGPTVQANGLLCQVFARIYSNIHNRDHPDCGNRWLMFY
jgi:hypothetical protein